MSNVNFSSQIESEPVYVHHGFTKVRENVYVSCLNHAHLLVYTAWVKSPTQDVVGSEYFIVTEIEGEMYGDVSANQEKFQSGKQAEAEAEAYAIILEAFPELAEKSIVKNAGLIEYLPAPESQDELAQYLTPGVVALIEEAEEVDLIAALDDLPPALTFDALMEERFSSIYPTLF